MLVLSAQSYGSLGIARSLGRLGIPVDAVDADPRRPASFTRFLRDRYRDDLTSGPPEAVVDRLLEIGSRVGRRSLLIPTSDETAVMASDFHDTLSQRFILPRQPAGLARSLANKKDMSFLARSNSIPTPDVLFPESVEEVAAFAATATFPVMLKGIDGNRLKLRTGRKMVIVEQRADLVPLYVEMEDPAQPNLMLQEYIPGGDDAVWMFNGYFDANSDCLVGFTGRKLRQTPAYTGVTSLGICLKNDIVADMTTRWMKNLGYRGILDIGYRYDARDGQYKVLDVNPRIGATFRLFVGRNGIDVARALYLDMTGHRVPAAEAREGRKWMVEGGDFDSFLQYRRDDRLTFRSWLSSLRGIEETAHFARDDLRPFLMVLSSFVRRMLPSRLRRREAGGETLSSGVIPGTDR